MNKFKRLFKKVRTAVRRVVARAKAHEIFNSPLFISFSTREQVVFAKRLSMVLRSGMPILQGLRMLEEEAHSRSVSKIAGSLADDVTNGLTLANALKKFESTVGEFFINIVRVGEASGTLPENLDYIAQELKKKNDLRRQVIGALVYPIIIVLATMGITTMLIVYIFPKILPIFLSLKADLPFSTRALIAVSNFLTVYGLWILGGIILGGIVYLLLLRIRAFHLLADRILLRIPIFGELSRFYNLANTCRTLSLLLKSDVRIVLAIDIAADSMKNVAYQDALRAIGENVLSGQRISTQLKKHKALFPPMLTQMMSVGETTGNLSDTLMYLSEMYETEIGDWTKNLTSVLEPVLMLTMGFLVGFIAISVITPIYGITQNLNR